jgi:uncharacterized iron-regulated membrane protein
VRFASDAKEPGRMKSKLRVLHRWLSLSVAVFWVSQALTGVFLVFHWEIGDALVAGPARPLDLGHFDATLRRLVDQKPGRTISSVWATAGRAGRYDVTVDEPSGDSISVRMDGQGEILNERPADGWADGGWVEKIVSFHQTLLAGDVGHRIVGVSGILLLTNIVLALKLAWPARGQWRRALLPPPARAIPAKLYGWHRALGLAIAPLALVTVACGTLLVFEDPVGEFIGAETPAPVQAENFDGTAAVGPGAAIATALARYPNSQLAGVKFPEADSPWYRIRVLQPDETRRVFGTTTILVGASTGRVLGDFDALTAPHARKFMEKLYPIHTGEIGGLVGRIMIIVIGVWLLTMITLGVSLWATRRAAAHRRADPARRSASPA